MNVTPDQTCQQGDRRTNNKLGSRRKPRVYASDSGNQTGLRKCLESWNASRPRNLAVTGVGRGGAEAGSWLGPLGFGARAARGNG